MKNCIEICDTDLKLKEKQMHCPMTKTFSCAIIINSDYKISLVNNKGKYTLPCYCVANKCDFEKQLLKSLSKQFRIKSGSLEKLCEVIDNQSQINCKKITHVFIAKNNGKDLNIPIDFKLVTISEALKLFDSYLKKGTCRYNKLSYIEKYNLLNNKLIIENFLNYLSSNDSTWSNLYKDYIQREFDDWEQYYNTKMRLKKRFLNEVIKYSKSGKPILECGCGTGKGSLYFALLGIDTYAMDLEQSMVDDTKLLSNKRCPNNPIKAFKGNANSIPFDDKFFSVTHSSGVLEHYSDEDIIKIINEQIRVSDYCIFSVPTKYFEKKMLGNERFLSRKQWIRIINKSNAAVIKKTGYHYKTIRKRIIDIIQKPKRLFKPIALYTFVLKERN